MLAGALNRSGVGGWFADSQVRLGPVIRSVEAAGRALLPGASIVALLVRKIVKKRAMARRVVPGFAPQQRIGSAPADPQTACAPKHSVCWRFHHQCFRFEGILMKPRTLALLLGVAAASAALAACSSMSQRSPVPPLPHASAVDLPRYMGRWYVISSIPTFLERGVVDATENYSLRPDGSVDIDFRYRRSPGTSEQALGSRGFVENGDNAIWRVQFIWPIRADYRIAWLAPDYSRVIVAREKRDYVWIMARTPTLPQADYDAMVQQVGAMGYDTARLERVPQGAARAGL